MPLAQVMLLEAGRMKEFDSPRSDGCFFSVVKQLWQLWKPNKIFDTKDAFKQDYMDTAWILHSLKQWNCGI